MNGTWATAIQAAISILGVILAAYGHPVAGGSMAVGAAVSSHDAAGDLIRRWSGQ